MNRRSIVVLGLAVLLALALTGCDLFSFVGATRGLQIGGFVLDEDGMGIVGAVVLMGSDAISITGVDGAWSYAHAKKGAKVTVEKDGWIFSSEPARVKMDNYTINFIGIPAPYGVSGHVFDMRGLAIEGVVITLEAANGTIKTAVTDTEGLFSVSGLTGNVTAKATLQGWEFTPETRVVTQKDTALDFYGMQILQ